MSKVVTVYFSGYGHTKYIAEAVHAGAAAVAGVEAELIAIDKNGDLNDAAWDSLAKANAIIFGAPTYMGMAPWQFKKFADASSKVWFTQGWKNKLAGGFTNSATMNGDKHSTLHYFITLAMQHSMLWAGTGLMPNNSKAADRNDINFVGSFSGLMTQTPSDANADEVLPGDVATAKLYGERIAQLAKQF